MPPFPAVRDWSRRWRRCAAAALVLLTAGCGGPRTARGLVYYFSFDPSSLDPAMATDVAQSQLVAMLFDTLTRFDADGRLLPGLATRWDVDATGRRYTFHLRRGVRFHDGRPLTAADVRASFLRVLRPSAGGSRAWPLFPIQGARAYAERTTDQVPGIAVPDDSTVVLELEEPLALFPKLLAMATAAVVPTPTPAEFGERPVGSGPWRFVRWAHDDEIVLARNEGYWDGPPLADTLRVRVIPEPLTRAAEYEAGNLSAVEIPFGETPRWELAHGAELQRRPALRATYIALNTTRGALRDPRVRRALNHAVDVPMILRTMMAGRGVPAAGAIPPGLAGHDSARARYRYDPAKARRLLAEAGYAGGLSLQLWRTGRPEYGRIAQAVQQYLGAVGVRVEIVERDAPSARAAARKGEADLFLTDWYADYPDAENFTYPLFHSRNHGVGGNYAFLSDATVDSLASLARVTVDTAAQARLYAAVDARVHELAPWLFCWFPVDLWALRPEVTGWRIPLVPTGDRWDRVRLAS